VLKNINTIGRYWKKKYKQKVYKVPISISGFTCPNIDGTVAKGGCTFCENESFSPNLTDKSRFKLNLNSKENPNLEKQLKQLEMQFTATIDALTNKFGAKKFIVYFQSFTNTYAPIETLKALYEKALSFDNVVGLSIGTRSDSITEETLDYLNELAENKEIWVEYGIQSIYDETLEAINRGHDFANVKEWIEKTKQRKNLKICGHLIFGLPGETKDMMLETTKATIDLGVDSIKYHILYVTKNTALAIDYKKGRFTPISEEDYLEVLVKSIQMQPDNIIIQRISSGINDSSLLAPLWCKNKHQQMRNIRDALKEVGYDY
jgi:radical SAM protein (TIGR01212 family)